MIDKKLQRKEKDRKLAEKTPTNCPTELESKLMLERAARYMKSRTDLRGRLKNQTNG